MYPPPLSRWFQIRTEQGLEANLLLKEAIDKSTSGINKVPFYLCT